MGFLFSSGMLFLDCLCNKRIENGHSTSFLCLNDERKKLTFLCENWSFTDLNQTTSESKFTDMYFPHPSTTGRKWYKVNFKRSWFEFRVLLQQD